MEATKLEKLLINEVSGVDDPANEIPGWMVAKSASAFKASRPIGPDQAWDVTSAEKRVREATGANDAPNATYASGFLHFDGNAPDEFGSYKFLVVDAVDGELKIMPQAVRMAISRLPDSDLSDTAKASVGSTLDALKAQAGIAETPVAGEPQTIAEKVRSWLFPAGKDDIEMTSEELTAALDARDEALVEKFAEAVAKSVAPAGASEGDELTPTDEAPAPAVTPEVEAEVVAPLTIEDIAKAIQEALAPYSEILEKTLDRTERVEIALGIAARKSLEGQEGGDKPEDTPTPTVKDAIGVALRNRTVAVARR